MISKESDKTKELIKLLFERTHKSEYVNHAISMIKDEDHAEKIIRFLKEYKEVEWQDIEYEIIKKSNEPDNKTIEDYGALFVDPSTLPGYVPPKKVLLREGYEYAKRVQEEENRQVTFEEMQQFVIR